MAEEDLRDGESKALESSQANFTNGHTTNVTGAIAAGAKSGKLKSVSIKTFGVVVAVIALVVLFATPIYAIDAISTRLIEETDVQYADSVQNKALVFQNALENGEIPENTFERLEQEGVEVGYMDGDTFVASRFGQTVVADLDSAITYSDAKKSALSLKLDDGTVIPASQFYKEVNSNVKLYNAFNNSTYSRAAYYYDEEAQRVFREIGTNRNNFGNEKSLEEIMDNIMGTGHNFGLGSQTWHYMPHWELADIRDPGSAYIESWYEVKDSFNCQGASSNVQIARWNNYKTTWHGVYDDDGNLIDYYYTIEDVAYADDNYGCITTESDKFIRTMAQSNMNDTGDFPQSNLNTIDTLKVSDTVTKEKRSMLLYAGIAESFSRTKAGYGSTGGDTNSILAAVATIGATAGGGADVNDIMNWLYESTTTVSYDEYGNPVYSTGSALESPSLYAVLTGEKLDVNEIKNYSSDRIATIYEKNAGTSEIGKYTVSRTLSETTKLGTSRVGRCAEQSNAKCIDEAASAPMEDATPIYNLEKDESASKNYNNGSSSASVSKVEPVIKDSLYENSFSTINGIKAGEMLVEGAVNVGYALAKASGMSDGTEQKVNEYLAMTSDVLAMDAAADRLNRSPLDITSKNTFLGSIVYKFAISTMKSGSLLNKIASTSRVLASAAKTLLPSASAADDEEDLYLAAYGNCETKGYIGATGTGTCATIGVSDTSTYENAYSNMQSWLSDNVECNGDNCSPKKDSSLEMYIKYHEMNHTPSGITDGEVLKAIESANEGGSIFSRAWRALKGLLRNISSLFGIDSVLKNKGYEVPPEATGESFVVGGEEWEKYKYAQRYIGLARAAETLRQYDGDETAYNFSGFGLGNPIARYINEHSEDMFAVNE